MKHVQITRSIRRCAAPVLRPPPHPLSRSPIYGPSTDPTQRPSRLAPSPKAKMVCPARRRYSVDWLRTSGPSSAISGFEWWRATLRAAMGLGRDSQGESELRPVAAGPSGTSLEIDRGGRQRGIVRPWRDRRWPRGREGVPLRWPSESVGTGLFDIVGQQAPDESQFVGNLLDKLFDGRAGRCAPCLHPMRASLSGGFGNCHRTNAKESDRFYAARNAMSLYAEGVTMLAATGGIRTVTSARSQTITLRTYVCPGSGQY